MAAVGLDHGTADDAYPAKSSKMVNYFHETVTFLAR
jgi:hypothetical protein